MGFYNNLAGFAAFLLLLTSTVSLNFYNLFIKKFFKKI